MIQGFSLIAGQFSKKGTNTFSHSNLNKGEEQNTYTEANISEIELAIDTASEAFFDLRKKNGSEVGRLLKTIASEIELLGESLISLCHKETALPIARITGERTRTVNQLNLFAQLVENNQWKEATIDYGDPNRQPLPKPDIRNLLIPIGPVVVFGASNFPLAFSVAGGDTASALAAGCPVIVKANPSHPGTSELVALAINNAIHKCGFPKGIFSLIQGISHNCGENLVQNPKIKAGAFTGSFNGGISLFKIASNRKEPIPFFAEMGSTNPVFIFPEIMKKENERLANEIFNSFTLGCGQFCTNPGIIILPPDNIHEEFIQSLSQKTMQHEGNQMLSERIKKAYDNEIEELINNHHFQIIAEGKHLQNACNAKTMILKIEAQDFLENKQYQNEVFGPSTILVETNNTKQYYEIANLLQGHLTTSIWATEKELEKNKELLFILEDKAGRIIFNGMPTGVDVGYAMQHGGPFPASTDSRYTSVGAKAIRRFVRPVCYQNILPDELQSKTKNILRQEDGLFLK